MNYFLLGALAALCIISATGSKLVLPRLENGTFELGFVGRLVIGGSVALMIDHDPALAFLGALVVLVAVDLQGWMRGARNGLNRVQDRRRLELLRRKLKVAEENLAMFGPGEAPIHLQIIVDETKREIAELEAELENEAA